MRIDRVKLGSVSEFLSNLVAVVVRTSHACNPYVLCLNTQSDDQGVDICCRNRTLQKHASLVRAAAAGELSKWSTARLCICEETSPASGM